MTSKDILAITYTLSKERSIHSTIACGNSLLDSKCSEIICYFDNS